jgi:hypothetical protein
MLDLGSGETIAVAASDDGELVSVRQRGSLNVLQITKGRLEVVDRLEIPSPGDLFAFQRPPLRFTEDHRLRLGSPQMVWEAGAGARPEEKQSLANIADLAADGMALWAISPGSFQLIGVDGVALSPELQCNGREIACSALSADGSTAMAADYDHNLWVWWLGERNASYEESTLA